NRTDAGTGMKAYHKGYTKGFVYTWLWNIKPGILEKNAALRGKSNNSVVLYTFLYFLTIEEENGKEKLLVYAIGCYTGNYPFRLRQQR
ncbi:MAG: hypothetical protein LBB80_01040, partial [Treponema sp.]|nr:hypothetical protein [Treponema sp.]